MVCPGEDTVAESVQQTRVAKAPAFWSEDRKENSMEAHIPLEITEKEDLRKESLTITYELLGSPWAVQGWNWPYTAYIDFED